MSLTDCDFTTRHGQYAHYSAVRERIASAGLGRAAQIAAAELARLRAAAARAQEKIDAINLARRAERARIDAAMNPPPAARPIDSADFHGAMAKAAAAQVARNPFLGSAREIQAAVALAYGIPLSEINSARRTANVVRPRHIAMYLTKTLTPKSLPEIGRRFGGRDHTTVLHAVKKIGRMMLEDAEFAAPIEKLRDMLSPRILPFHDFGDGI